MTAVLLGVLGVGSAVTSAEADGPLFGHDVSWPQCPTSDGGYNLPLPPDSSEFVIIGLTKGLAFTENPCLASQVRDASDRDIPAHAYTMATFPTAAQLTAHKSAGPFNASTRAGQLSNVGYAEGRFALASLARIGWAPEVVWIDVEPRPAQPWPSGTAAQVENRWVIEGIVRALRDAGVGYGFYSYANGWQEITGGWSVPGVPVWATAGKLDYPEEAADRCTQPSFSGGAVHISQWTDGTRDYNRTCGTYSFTPTRTNLVGAATTSASSVDAASGATHDKAVDGSTVGYPTDLRMEWSSDVERAGAWIELTWPSPVRISEVVLSDRPNADDQVTAGVLSFSDGTSVPVGMLPNDGAAVRVQIPERAVNSVRFTVTGTSPATWATGLAELEVWGQAAPPAGGNVAGGAAVVASSENVGTGQTAVKVVDGSSVGYPGDYSREWATVRGGAGSWVELRWPGKVTVDRVVLFDRPNLTDWVTGGSLQFDDGTIVPVGALQNDGSATTVTFPARTVGQVRFTISQVGAGTVNTGLAELEVYGF